LTQHRHGDRRADAHRAASAGCPGRMERIASNRRPRSRRPPIPAPRRQRPPPIDRPPRISGRGSSSRRTRATTAFQRSRSAGIEDPAARAAGGEKANRDEPDARSQNTSRSDRMARSSMYRRRQCAHTKTISRPPADHQLRSSSPCRQQPRSPSRA
jgi:hypothetical protein